MFRTRFLTIVITLGFLLPLTSGAQEESRSPLLAGTWALDVERTRELLRSTTDRDVEPVLASVRSMRWVLADEGTFEMSLSETMRIIGDWSAASVDRSSNQDDEPTSWRLTLVPKNLDDHADMVFDITFVTADIIKAVPQRGVATVFLKRDEADDGGDGDGGDGDGGGERIDK